MSYGGNARQIAEIATDLIVSFIKAEFDAAAAQLRTSRADPRVDTQKFKAYYLSPKYQAFPAPSCYVICKEILFQKAVKGANHVNAISKFIVSAVVEAKDADLLMLGVYRYQAILQKILDQSNLTAQNNALKIVIVVDRAYFTDLYQKTGDAQGAFRQEAILECDVACYENQ